MEKAESLNFPTAIGSGGPGQSLHNEILLGAKPFNPQYPTFLLDVCPRIFDFNSYTSICTYFT
jgi:hypothetical protein